LNVPMTPAWMPWAGTVEIQSKRPILCSRRIPTHGAFMICMAMSGSGARTGFGIIPQARLPTRKALHLANTLYCGAAAGTATPGTAVRPIATGTPRTAATTLPASGLPGVFSYTLYLYFLGARANAKPARLLPLKRDWEIAVGRHSLIKTNSRYSGGRKRGIVECSCYDWLHFDS